MWLRSMNIVWQLSMVTKNPYKMLVQHLVHVMLECVCNWQKYRYYLWLPWWGQRVNTNEVKVDLCFKQNLPCLNLSEHSNNRVTLLGRNFVKNTESGGQSLFKSVTLLKYNRHEITIVSCSGKCWYGFLFWYHIRVISNFI